MGLSNQLADVSSDSIPILILINAVRGVSYIRYLFFCLMHTVVGLGLSHHHSEAAAASSSSSSSSSAVGSGLAGLVVLADHLVSNRPFAWAPQTSSSTSTSSSSVGPAAASSCVVCLEGLGEGERVRRLACCHVFHSECLDGWMIGEMNLSCPLCRSPVVAEERRGDAERRIGAELVAWLSPY